MKAGYGMYYDTLNAADYTHNSTGFSSTTINTNSTDFGQTFTLGNPYAGVLANADPFPVRAAACGSSSRLATRSAPTRPSARRRRSASTLKHARQQRWRVAVQREVFVQHVGRGVLRLDVFGSRAGRHPAGLPAGAVLDSRQPERARRRRADGARRQRAQPVQPRQPGRARRRRIPPSTTGFRPTASSRPRRSRATGCCGRSRSTAPAAGWCSAISRSAKPRSGRCRSTARAVLRTGSPPTSRWRSPTRRTRARSRSTTASRRCGC